MSTLADQEILSALDAWAAAHVGPDATIAACVRMPGDSSLTYGVEVASGGAIERLVLRLPPSGSARQSAALLRQVRLLRVVGTHGVPVPDVRWSDEDPRPIFWGEAAAARTCGFADCEVSPAATSHPAARPHTLPTGCEVELRGCDVGPRPPRHGAQRERIVEGLVCAGAQRLR